MINYELLRSRINEYAQKFREAKTKFRLIHANQY